MPRPVVHRQHDVALVRPVLVHGVRRVVEVPVVVAEEHLPARSAVDEDERRPPLAGPQVRWQEELVVELQPVLGGEGDVLRLDVRTERIPPRQRRDDPGVTSVGGEHGDGLGPPGVRVERGELAARSQGDRIRLDRVALGELPPVAPRDGHAPQVPAVDVRVVRRVEERAAVLGERVLHDEALSGRQLDGLRPRVVDGDRVPVPPVPGLRFEDDVVALPVDLVDVAEALLVARRAAPEPEAFAGARVGDPDLQVVSPGEGGLHEAGGERVGVGVAEVRVGAERIARRADERDARPVGRPRRAAVMVDARSQVGDGRAPRIVDADEGVVVPVAHVRDALAVGRPHRIFVVAVRGEERLARLVPVARPEPTGARWIWPSRSKATHRPSDDSVYAVASTTRQGDPPRVLIAHTARSAPRGSLAGLATHPRDSARGPAGTSRSRRPGRSGGPAGRCRRPRGSP
jgi:hypothetical protein